MPRYTLVNVEKQVGDRVNGSWIQDKIGTFEEAVEFAIHTEEVNSNKIDVAVVDGRGIGQPFPSLPPGMKRLDRHRNKGYHRQAQSG